jgi:hypothetical protein
MRTNPEHAAATTTTGRQQNTEIAATAQPELSDAPMLKCTFARFVPVHYPAELAASTCLIYVRHKPVHAAVLRTQPVNSSICTV